MDELPIVYATGQNKFGQFKTLLKPNCDSQGDKSTFGSKFGSLFFVAFVRSSKVVPLIGINWAEFGDFGANIINFDISVTVNYSAVAVDFKVVISSIDIAKEDDKVEKASSEELTVPFSKAAGGRKTALTKTFNFDDLVAKIQTTSSYCLVLLEEGDLYKIVMPDLKLEKVNFVLETKDAIPKKSIFALPATKKQEPERMVDIACGEKVCVAITNHNAIYNLPTKTAQFLKHQNIKKICCGAEHAMILTTNGDLYTWGTGLRGQLGHGTVDSEESPKLVEALAGVKITDIGAGTFHSVAVSVFGDVYTWGWNLFGQLGHQVLTSDELKSQKQFLQRKNQTVYTVPLLVDLVDQIEGAGGEAMHVLNVYCGAKHTVIRTKDHRVFVTGSNSFNQLGLVQGDADLKQHRGRVKTDIFLDKFKQLKVGWDVNMYQIYCACSCTLFIENK